ncbi:hypothetical protein NSQ77_13460 [Oceanobacillus sp. FSL K6-2867]|uniref:hypothetical protein n=1 Tax=Oceanobacillus sp. FSL K6-2867 TaxID=2954748 RepID=UPI0030D95332
MKSKLLIRLGAPVLALSLVAACGTDNEQDPVEDNAPMEPTEENGENQDNMMEDDNLDGAPNEEEVPNDNLGDDEDRK